MPYKIPISIYEIHYSLQDDEALWFLQVKDSELTVQVLYQLGYSSIK